MIKTITKALVIAGLLFFSCKKETVQGPKGDKGDPGPGGTLGSTTTILLSSSEWKKDSTTSHYKWNAVVFVPEISQQIVKKGSINVFVQIDTKWVELPYLDDDDVTQYSFVETLLTLNLYNLHSNVPAKPPARYIRVVTIPG